MLDAGTATYRAGEYLTTPELDIFLTHAHLDHVVGLTYLFSVMQRSSAAADHGPRAAGEAGGGRGASVRRGPVSRAAALRVSPAGREFRPGRRRPADPFPAGAPGRVDRLPARLARPLDGLCDRHDGRRRTPPTWRKSAGSICWFTNVTFPTPRPSGREKRATATRRPWPRWPAQAGVKRLVLVHLNPLSTADDPIGLDVARAIFPNTILGEDRMEVGVLRSCQLSVVSYQLSVISYQSSASN